MPDVKIEHPLPASSRLAAFNQMVDAEQDQRSDKRHEEASGLVRLIVTDGAANPGTQKSARDADEHSDKDAARLLAGYDQFGKRTDNKTNNCRPQQMKHRYSSVISRGCRVVYKWCGKHTPAFERCGTFVFVFRTIEDRKRIADTFSNPKQEGHKRPLISDAVTFQV